MSLAPALLERLKRRGIIVDAEKKPSEKSTKHPKEIVETRDLHASRNNSAAINEEQGEEEILAADYSDEENSENEDEEQNRESDSDKSDKDSQDNIAGGGRQGLQDEEQVNAGKADECQNELVECILGCPNKYNIYHTCSQYCKDQYEERSHVKPTVEKRKQLARLLRTFPLPNEWKVVYDPGVSTFYFWNVVSNQVSWYPPGMGAIACPPAEYIRNIMRLDRQQQITSKLETD